MKSAVTISLVAQARGGPFVFWDGLADGCAQASALGFDAVEIFAPSADAVDRKELGELLDRYGLKVAAFGTGGGWVVQKWTLTHSDSAVRQKARDFIRAFIDLGAEFDAPAIVGSMQGRWDGEVTRERALGYLGEALKEFDMLAATHELPLFFEPLNRYETNLFNRTPQTAEWLRTLQTKNLRVLCDLFHMNIEEPDVPAALREAGVLVGHVHFADSNRHAIGFGHCEVVPIIAALRDIEYDGYLSAEIFALPDSLTAARQTIDSYRRFVGPSAEGSVHS